MNIRRKWIALGRLPMVKQGLFLLGCFMIIVSPLVGIIPGPGGVVVFAFGFGLVLKYSAWAKRQYVKFKLRNPNKGRWADWSLRRESARRREELRTAEQPQPVGEPQPASARRGRKPYIALWLTAGAVILIAAFTAEDVRKSQSLRSYGMTKPYNSEYTRAAERHGYRGREAEQIGAAAERVCRGTGGSDC